MNKDLLKASERIDRLHAQDIDIIQSAEVFAFSLDAVLLALPIRLEMRAQ